MNANVRLYLIPGLSDENNYIVENIQNFLSQGFEPLLEIEGFQYQRLESSKEIKIDYPQQGADLSGRDWNYCAIQNDGGSVAYYFVVEYEQRAKGTVLLRLKLDVLNTFWDYYKREFAEGTYIARAHRDRYRLHAVNEEADTASLTPIFDRVAEGETPALHATKEDERTFADMAGGDDGDLRFCLIYRTSQDGRPCVDMASAGNELLISRGSEGSGDYVLLLSEMVIGRYYYLVGEFSLSVQYMTYYAGLPTGRYDEYFSTLNGFVRFGRNPTRPDYIEVLFYDESRSYYTSGYEQIIVKVPGGTNYRQETKQVEGPVTIRSARKMYYSSEKTSEGDVATSYEYQTINAGTYADVYLPPISLLDRTSSNNVKVIECPYSPVPYQYVDGVYMFSDFFETKSPEGFFRTYNLSKKFPKRTIARVSFPQIVSKVYPIRTITHVARPFLKDPKTYTGAYYRPTFFYDSFAYSVRMEDYRELTPATTTPYFSLDLNYKQSSAISSALLFEIASHVVATPSYTKYYSDTNFDEVLLASRNNEVPLYSSEYLNYLRNGYNYDKKKLSQSLDQNLSAAFMQTAAAALSFMLQGVGGATLNPAIALAGVGLAAGAASSVANISYSQRAGNDAIDEKINTLKKQGYSVAGVDDLDLFQEYGKNKLKYKLYKASDKDMAKTEARFQYFGYATEAYAKPWPFYTSSRKFYNFLQIDPIFTEAGKATAGEFLDEISAKLRAGVTIWHEAGYVENEYRLDRDVENVENSIIEGIRDI